MPWYGTPHPGRRYGIDGGIGSRGWSPYRKKGGKKCSQDRDRSQWVCSRCRSVVSCDGDCEI